MSRQLGAHLGQQNLSSDALRALWRRFDAAGLDWISCWDHFYEAPPAGGTQPHFEAIALLGALATETKHAQIGCLVFYPGYRNPASIAKAATTIDHRRLALRSLRERAFLQRLPRPEETVCRR